MNFFIVMCLTCVALIALVQYIFKRKKALFTISIFIVVLVLANSVISIAKLKQYATNISLFYHENIFMWNPYERILSILTIALFFILLILIVRETFLGFKKHATINIESEKKKTVFILTGILICCIVLLSVYTQNVYYKKNVSDDNISIEQIELYNPNKCDEETINRILERVSKEIKNEGINNVISDIVKSKNIHIVEHFETNIYDFTFADHLQHRLYSGFDIDYNASLQYGEFEVIHLEYSLAENRKITDFHTFILFGESPLNELIVEVITISETDTLTFIMVEPYNDGHNIAFYSEILKTDYR